MAMKVKKWNIARGKTPVAAIALRRLPADAEGATARIKAMLAEKMHNACWEFGIVEYRALAELIKPLSGHDRAVVMAGVIKHLKETDRLSHLLEAHFRERGFL